MKHNFFKYCIVLIVLIWNTSLFSQQNYELKQRAEQGDALSQFQLAVRYSYGDGLPVDKQEAIYWYKKAANEIPEAQNNLGKMYFNGEGVPINYNTAIYWFKMAGNNGYHPSSAMVAKCYYKGIGVPIDKEKAFYWFKIAAEQGNGDSQLAVALMYASDNISRNKEVILYWLKKAKANGVPEANNYLVQFKNL